MTDLKLGQCLQVQRFLTVKFSPDQRKVASTIEFSHWFVFMHFAHKKLESVSGCVANF